MLSKEQAEEANKKARRAVIEKAQKFKRVFTSPEGEEVLGFMINDFIMNNSTQMSSPNVNYEAAYHNGEAGVVRYIIEQIRRADEH